MVAGARTGTQTEEALTAAGARTGTKAGDKMSAAFEARTGIVAVDLRAGAAAGNLGAEGDDLGGATGAEAAAMKASGTASDWSCRIGDKGS